MNLRAIVIALAVVTIVLGYLAWQRTAQNPAAQAPPQQQGDVSGGMPGMPGMPPAPAGDPGVAWDDPRGWAREEGHGMRVATYTIPGPGGEAQCPVYYFGPGQGGGVDPNIERWIGEFEAEGAPERSASDVAGMRVSRVTVKGTYLAHGAMGGGGGTQQADWMLLGAIVEGPNGSLFFKLTGPSATVNAASGPFDAMLSSLKKSS